MAASGLAAPRRLWTLLLPECESSGRGRRVRPGAAPFGARHSGVRHGAYQRHLHRCLHGAHRRLDRLCGLSALRLDRRRIVSDRARRPDRACGLQRGRRPLPRPRRSERPDRLDLAQFRRPGAPARRVRPPARHRGDQGRFGARQGAGVGAAARRRDRGTVDPGQASRRLGGGARGGAGGIERQGAHRAGCARGIWYGR